MISKFIVFENGARVEDIDLDGNTTPLLFDSVQQIIDEYVRDTDLPAVVWYNNAKIYAHPGIYGKSLYKHTPDEELTQILIKRIEL